VLVYHPQQFFAQLRGGLDVDFPTDHDDRRGTKANVNAQVRWLTASGSLLRRGECVRHDDGGPCQAGHAASDMTKCRFFPGLFGWTPDHDLNTGKFPPS
jgi:hypothetical protein